MIFPSDTKAGEDRYSIAYFNHPLDEAQLVAVPSHIVREHKEKLSRSGAEGEDKHGYGGGMTGQRAMTAKEHLMKRLGATYKVRVER